MKVHLKEYRPVFVIVFVIVWTVAVFVLSYQLYSEQKKVIALEWGVCPQYVLDEVKRESKVREKIRERKVEEQNRKH